MFSFNRLLTFFLLTIGMTGTEESPDQWDIVEVENLSPFLADRLQYQLSPDGTTVAWSANGELCFLTITTKQTNCHNLPQQWWLISWSPNNAYLLLANHADYDLSRFWAYDRTAENFIWFTDRTYPFFVPLWHPSGEALYYWQREQKNGQEVFSLYQHSLITRDKEAIIDSDGQFIVPDHQNALVAVSPDGTQLISLVYEGWFASPYRFWIIDIMEQEVKPFLRFNELQQVLPDWYTLRFSMFDPIAWNSESNDLVATLQAIGYPEKSIIVLMIDSETGEVTPLLDYLNLPVPNQDPLHNFGGDISPDGALYFYYDNDGLGNLSIFALPLYPPNSQPLLISQDYSFSCGRTTLLITAQRDGKIQRYIYGFGEGCIEGKNPYAP